MPHETLTIRETKAVQGYFTALLPFHYPRAPSSSLGFTKKPERLREGANQVTKDVIRETHFSTSHSGPGGVTKVLSPAVFVVCLVRCAVNGFLHHALTHHPHSPATISGVRASYTVNGAPVHTRALQSLCRGYRPAPPCCILQQACLHLGLVQSNTMSTRLSAHAASSGSTSVTCPITAAAS